MRKVFNTYRREVMTKKSNAGRPTDMTTNTVNKLEEAFALGCTDIEACLFAGISKQTLYNYQKKNPEFVDRKAQLKETPVLKARSVVMKALNEDDKQTGQWLLERKKRNEFSLRTEQQDLDKEGQPTDPVDQLLKFIEESAKTNSN